MEELIIELRKFALDREWDKYHNPKNLVMALSAETGELVEIFQWLTEEESLKERISPKDYDHCKQEIADIFLYLIRLSDKLEVDLLEAAKDKIKLNAQKYPVSLSKGNATKYNKR
ncbi:nucleotide pyrophosphohydrolase [Cryomorphaceae bacterium]|nr:nucleotide pyrophosphohydrolase [Cryomorphaceae bacterium]